MGCAELEVERFRVCRARKRVGVVIGVGFEVGGGREGWKGEGLKHDGFWFFRGERNELGRGCLWSLVWGG